MEDRAVGKSTSTLPATYPWFIATVDSSNDFGQHVSIAIDPDNGAIFISYYDANNEDLHMAK